MNVGRWAWLSVWAVLAVADAGVALCVKTVVVVSNLLQLANA